MVGNVERADRTSYIYDFTLNAWKEVCMTDSIFFLGILEEIIKILLMEQRVGANFNSGWRMNSQDLTKEH